VLLAMPLPAHNWLHGLSAPALAASFQQADWGGFKTWAAILPFTNGQPLSQC